MTLEELKNRVVIVGVVFRGHFMVRVFYNKTWNYGTSTNTLAYDVITSGEKSQHYTLKQAYQALWNEITRTMKQQSVWE